MKHKVVVIGHGYTSRLGVIRALGREGYEVIVIVMTSYKKDGKTLYDAKPIDCYSRYVSKYYFCPSDREKLVNLLLEKCVVPGEKVVVFADSDFSAATVDLNQDRLSPYFLFSHINHETGAVVSWMNKLRQKHLAEEVGLNVAKGWVVEIKAGKYEIPADICYPCFPKPIITLVGGKGGLRRCDDEKQLRRTLDQLCESTPDIEVLVEEFKHIDTEHALVGFTDGKEIIIPGVIKTLSLANAGHFGVAKQGEIIPVKGYEDLVERFKQFVLKTGFVGVFDIDFFESEGAYYFCEMNFRYGGSGYAYTAMGVNLPLMMMRTMLGESIDAMKRDITERAVFVNERMLRDDWNSNYISSREFRRILCSADISFLIDEDDKEPQRVFFKDVNSPVRHLKRFVKRIIGQ